MANFVDRSGLSHFLMKLKEQFVNKNDLGTQVLYLYDEQTKTLNIMPTTQTQIGMQVDYVYSPSTKTLNIIRK